MPTPGEYKTVQPRLLEYADAIGWTIVSREEAERRRGFDPDVLPADRAKNRSLFFDDLLDVRVRDFNPRYAEAEGALLGQFGHLHTDIYGNRELVEQLRNRGKFFDHEEKPKGWRFVQPETRMKR
jgi:type I restriction enzyme, R subunit